MSNCFPIYKYIRFQLLPYPYQFWYLVNLLNIKWYFMVVSISICLVINEVEHFFIYLLVNHVSSSVKWLFVYVFCLFSYWVICHLHIDL